MIWLARHGETDDNRPPARVQGLIDVPLNEHGRAQAAELAARVVALPRRPAALWSSHLRRALETAQVVGDALGLTPRVDERLAESHRGRWEGRTWAEIAQTDPDGFAAWRRAGSGFRFPGGESLGEQRERVEAALADVASAARPALVVCHGGSIRTALCASRGLGLEHFHDFDVPNAALLELEVS